MSTGPHFNHTLLQMDSLLGHCHRVLVNGDCPPAPEHHCGPGGAVPRVGQTERMGVLWDMPKNKRPLRIQVCQGKGACGGSWNPASGASGGKERGSQARITGPCRDQRSTWHQVPWDRSSYYTCQSASRLKSHESHTYLKRSLNQNLQLPKWTWRRIATSRLTICQ